MAGAEYCRINIGAVQLMQRIWSVLPADDARSVTDPHQTMQNMHRYRSIITLCVCAAALYHRRLEIS